MIRPGDQERPGRTNVLALGDRPFTAHKAPAEVQGGGRCVGHGGCYRRCAWRDVGFTAAGWEGGRGVAVASAWCGAAVCVSSHRLQWHRCGPGGVSAQDGRYIPTQLIAGVFRCCGGSGCQHAVDEHIQVLAFIVAAHGFLLNQLSWFTVTVYCRRRLWSWPNRAVLRFTCSSGVDYGVEVDSVSAHWTLRVVFSFSIRGPQSLPGANSCEGETLNGKGDSFTLCLLKNALNFFASNGGLPVCFPSVHLKSWTTF